MLKSKIKSNQLFDWLFSFWKDADTKDEIVHWHNGNSKGISYCTTGLLMDMKIIIYFH